DWMRRRMLQSILHQACGFSATSFTFDGESYDSTNYIELTGMQAVTAPSSTRIFRPNAAANDQTVNSDTTATAKLTDIDSCVKLAVKNYPVVPTLSEEGIQFVYLTHVDTFYQLLQDTSAPIQLRQIFLNIINATGNQPKNLAGMEFDYLGM